MINKIRMIMMYIFYKLYLGNKTKWKGIPNLLCSVTIRITNRGQMVSGKGLEILSNVGIFIPGGNITIGENVFINRNCMIVSREHIMIGDDCSFGPNVVIYDHDHIFNREGYEKQQYNTASVIIENGCWIGANVVILKGSHIGKGCVIGAGCVVSGDIPDHSLVKSDRNINIVKITDEK